MEYPDSKVRGVNMGPTWVLSAPDGPHVGPMNLAIRVSMLLIMPSNYNLYYVNSCNTSQLEQAIQNAQENAEEKREFTGISDPRPGGQGIGGQCGGLGQFLAELVQSGLNTPALIRERWERDRHVRTRKLNTMQNGQHRTVQQINDDDQCIGWTTVHPKNYAYGSLKRLQPSRYQIWKNLLKISVYFFTKFLKHGQKMFEIFKILVEPLRKDVILSNHVPEI